MVVVWLKSRYARRCATIWDSIKRRMMTPVSAQGRYGAALICESAGLLKTRAADGSLIACSITQRDGAFLPDPRASAYSGGRPPVPADSRHRFPVFALRPTTDDVMIPDQTFQADSAIFGTATWRSRYQLTQHGVPMLGVGWMSAINRRDRRAQPHIRSGHAARHQALIHSRFDLRQRARRPDDPCQYRG